MKKLIIPILTLACLASLWYAHNVHDCRFRTCPMIGQIVFKGCYPECIEGSDCYILDRIHWEYPNASYDECEDMLFKPKK